MKVENTHKRIINQPKAKITALILTLSQKDDKVWPKHYWPAIRFKEGLKVGSSGGHGIIRYKITEFLPDSHITFMFLKPIGFNGLHKFEIERVNENSTCVSHKIVMSTEGLATLKWLIVIRWLHDALIENTFDRIENNFSETKVFTKWSLWVRLWRFIFRLFR
ncbi:hypothetical protein [Hyunsoonleella pacifica]|uniref:SRPBCC family protein n=1 Tax=Hyunsoonleella pacifica TaxID=1080224 RepID=A0A4V2JB90_9FLAO|nr:hypothetical protein [Hyunsoonleella pacifica]TBN17848.1 hypothetical protein EYD46_05920 [Hyunsoonleella pacifica]GGD08449.1 hypothetical protein GCM10011368_07960 [Hyunsoonleella pacifica]